MSQPILTRNVRAINITSGVDTISPVIDVSDCSVATMQCIWAGTTPAGTINVECSLDGSNWATFGVTAVNVNTASGNTITSFNLNGIPFIRINYDYTSGTITSLRVFVATKQPA